MAVRPIPRPKVPRLGRPAGAFTQHRRIDLLRAKLEAHSTGLTLEELATMLRMTTRSVRRYLRELAHVTEVESIAIRPGGAHLWRIKPSERGRTVALRRTQAYALLAARRVYDVLRGSALYDEVDVALREIEQIAHRPVVRAPARGRAETPGDTRLEERFAYIPPPPHLYGGRSDDMDELFRALAELRVLRFRHRERSGETERARSSPSDRGAPAGRSTVHPYALVLHGGAIACIGRDVARDVTRAYAFEAMSELEASEGERFEVPPDFALSEWLHGAFGVGRAPRMIKLLVEFEPRVAEAVRARRVHPSQKLAVAADGRVRASLVVPDVPDIVDRVRSWVLGFGAAARVLEPRDLADELSRELQRGVERYRT